MHDRHGYCRCYIIPPHVLHHMAAHEDPQIRNAARSTQLINRGLHTQREIFGVMAGHGLTAGGLHRTVFDARRDSQLPGVSARTENGPATQDRAVSEAFDGAGTTHDFFVKVFKRASIDDHGMHINSTVHYQEDPAAGYDNAFWNGRQMVYGDGDGELFGSFTASLDVIAHELTHGVTQFEAGLVYHKQSGALNESFSDVFGSMVKQWHLNQKIGDADWLIGRELLQQGVQSGSPGPAALRSLKAPGTAYNDPRLGRDPQPAHMSNYQNLADNLASDSGGVHINSGIPNRAFYLACTNLGAPQAWDKAGPIWYAALRALHPHAKFVDAARTTVMYAQQLYGTEAATAVRAAWQEVGVLASREIVHVMPLIPVSAPA